ncbi:hypothetical protein GCM10022226_07580 [Sphaerisporangium flaviroseum]|uniref:CU044_5270 family protein n=1 Tax=Sphaerisporangium flaviroseum TaxID=509199 RepID=A0ABP7HFD4_9ACTN
MNDLHALRDLYGAPDIDAFAHGRIRVRVNDGVSRPRRRRPSWKVVTAGVAVVAGAVVVAVPGVPTRLGLWNEATTSASALVTGREILLRVAAQAESAPVATGTYWHVRTFSHNTFPEQLGEGANRYWVEESDVSETWSNRDGESWRGYRELGVRPKTPADEEAWRRDGSPTEWDKTMEPNLVAELSTRPEEGVLTPPEVADHPHADTNADQLDTKAFHVAGGSVTYAALQELPADPDALKAWVERSLSASTEPSEYTNFNVARSLSTELLLDVPAPPKVRAAAYRALAEMQNIRYVGEAKDDWGRPGAEFSILGPAGKLSTNLIIDPRTSLILSSRVAVLHKGELLKGKSQTATYLDTGWTDAEPAVPAIPQGYPVKVP